MIITKRCDITIKSNFTPLIVLGLLSCQGLNSNRVTKILFRKCRQYNEVEYSLTKLGKAGKIIMIFLVRID